MSGQGNSTVTEQSAPNPQFQAAYGSVLDQAQGVAAAPYTPYSGQQVADLTPAQEQAFGEVEGEQGAAQPFIGQAENDFNSATAPLWSGVQQFSPSAIQQYESPYTSDVVNSTQAEFNNQNQQQQEQLAGNEVSNGSWGGDRTGVAAANLAGQQELSEAPTIANLENTGYQTAESEFNTQQSSQLGANEANAWLNSQAGFGTAQLGSELQSTNLNDATALEQVGSSEQQQNQANLNVPYETYLAEQAYPFQTTNFLSGITSGVGSEAGGTSSSTTDESALSQIAGVGESGLGIAGLTGGFGSSGWLTSLLGGSSLLSDSALAGLDSGAAGLAGSSGAADTIAALFAAAARGGAIPGRYRGGIAGNDNHPPHRAKMTGTYSRGGIAAYDDGGDVFDMTPTPRPTLPTDAAPMGIAASGDTIPTAPPAPSGIASRYMPDYTPPSPTGGIAAQAGDIRAQSPWMALAEAGANTLATGNIGKGFTAGLNSYGSSIKQATDLEDKQQEASDTGNYRLADLKQKGMQLSDAADEAKARLAQTDQDHQDQMTHDAQVAAETARHNKADESNTSHAQSMEQQRLDADSWDAPKLLNVPDGTGGQTQILGQQNKLTGQWATADASRSPINAKGITIDTSTATGGGGRYQAQAGRILTDAKDATTDLGNLVNLPITASTGWFGNRGADSGKSLLTSTIDVLANKVTPQEVQDTNTTAIGLGRALAGLETGGMQVNQGLMSQFEKLQLADGDTQFTKMRKLATMRQNASNALETFSTSPLASPEQKKYALGMLDDLGKAIPWTPADVTKLEYSKNPQVTIADIVRQNKMGNPAGLPKELPGGGGNGGGSGAPQFQEGQTLHQNGAIFKVINGTPVYQGAGP